MALRLLDVYAAPDALDRITRTWPADVDLIDRRTLNLTGDDRQLARLLVDARYSEAALDHLEHHAGPDVRVVVSTVNATLPRPELADEAPEDEDTATSRINREELYADLSEAVSVTPVHFALVVLSTIVAAAGILRDSVAVVIGAMVIAPLIGPNIALALGTTLADRELLKRATQVNLLGLLLAFGLSWALGMAIPVDASIGEISARTQVGLSDVLLALAAGIAGALSTTRGLSTALVGVMVAVALMPPLVVLGLLLGSAQWTLAGHTGLLLTTNVVGVNLAAVGTFLAQGIRPGTWYEAQKARQATRWALLLWTTALAVLVVAILAANGWL
ncbi:TIGR00341 family protein [Salisaeta longa]|uniref:TIGR00341 family protein n=1 Tax=Salisaeta longa TaxID=503170 RepID=UPI0003B59667|nr:TIGR00341 family protein [Salisaeta longa]